MIKKIKLQEFRKKFLKMMVIGQYQKAYMNQKIQKKQNIGL